MKKKVVLAYSGGLDTSFCVKYLSEDLGFEVHSVLVDTGGFNKEELDSVERKAYELGVKRHTTLNALSDFYEQCIKYLIFGNVLRNSTYPLSVSAERIFQAKAIANYAKSINADAVAHGSTGAGNDQVRFDMIFNILIPNVEIITPIRDMKLSREAEIEYLKEKGVSMDWSKAQYSINQGIWGTSVGGKETLRSDQYLPDEAFPTQLEKSEPERVSLTFEKGELVLVNGEQFNHPVEAIKKLQSIAGPFAIGRDIHVGDTIIGIKGRVGFEAAAPLIIIKAHHLLEKHTLTKWQQYWKEMLSNWYGMSVHEGQLLEPVMQDIEQFLTHSQQHVSGEVKVELLPFRFVVLGVQSDNDLMSAKFGAYGEVNEGWTGEDVKGFSKIFSNQISMFHQIHSSHEN